MIAANISFAPLGYEDADFAARISDLMDADHSITPAELRERWENTEKTCEVLRTKVEVGGEAVGWLSVVRDHADTIGAVEVHLLLPGASPEVQAAGLARLEEMASSIGGKRLQSGVAETNRAAVAAFEAAPAWELKRRERFWRLQVQPNAARLLQLRDESRRRMAAAGVELRTAADLGGGEAVFRTIHELDAITSQDIPSTLPIETPPFEDWMVWAQPPRIQPERIWLALVEDRVVGYSALSFQPSLVQTWYTGVLREHRGRGIARALKLETLGQAVELGVETVETDNDSENAPILKLNAELGYEELPSRIYFHKDSL